MNFLRTLFRFFFRFETSQENQLQSDSHQGRLSLRISPESSSGPRGLGQMERQVAAMVQIPLSAREVRVQFSAIGEDGITGVVSESDVITSDGIHAQKTHHLIITASGHVTKATGIKVKCGFCGKFDSTLHRCSEPICRLPLCELHAIIVELYGQRVCFCPVHAISAENNRDNWKQYWLAQERRNYASNSA